MELLITTGYLVQEKIPGQLILQLQRAGCTQIRTVAWPIQFIAVVINLFRLDRPYAS